MTVQRIACTESEVLAILQAPRVVEIRRAVKPPPHESFTLCCNTGIRHSHGWSWRKSARSLSVSCPGREMLAACPYGVPGDRLWVQEAWQYRGGGGPIDKQPVARVRYLADGAVHAYLCESWPAFGKMPPRLAVPRDFDARYLAKYPADMEGREKWARDDFLSDWWARRRTPQTMPRWASRLALEVVGVRVDGSGKRWDWVLAGRPVADSDRTGEAAR